MRLTVHVSNARKNKVEAKQGDGSFKTITKTMNTLSFKDVTPKDKDRILARIESEKLGTPTKSYFSN